MLLPEETLYGLHMSGMYSVVSLHFIITLHFTSVYSFVELAKSLLDQDGSRFLLSERFTQDPLEAFFGKQRARGGRSDNPTVKRFVENTQAIRVSRSLALGGSSSVKRTLEFDIEKLSEKLHKRPRLSKQ